jgi:2-hydroxychromene-2-carboxylate isomerase
MDCRREARRRGLLIRGPRKLFDSSIAHIGFLYAKARGDFRAYHDAVFERFWRRELDIEQPAAIAALLEEVGIDASGFAAWLRGPGREEHDAGQREAEARGVFGVPSYLVGDELYWGAERLPRVREQVLAGAGSRIP